MFCPSQQVNKQGKHGFHYKKEKNGVTKNIDINIDRYLTSMARSRVPTIVEIETEIDIPLTSVTEVTLLK